MRKVEAVIGEKYYYLTVVSLAFMKRSATRNISFVSVQCDCGIIKDVNFRDLRASKIKSCGCKASELTSKAVTTHGLTQDPLYEVWASMKKRCDNPNTCKYCDYGGRGIAYQESWFGFESFHEDMSSGYQEGLELDREDTNGNYTKENCRWVTPGTNCHNRRKRKGSKCLSIGVCMKESKFRAQLSYEGSTVFRETFLTEQEAAQAYDDASEQYYGDRPNKTSKELLVPI